MKKIKLEGEFCNEVKLQLEQIDALNGSIRNISQDVRKIERKMWDYVKKEMNEISDNCTLKIENDEVIFTDRMSD